MVLAQQFFRLSLFIYLIISIGYSDSSRANAVFEILKEEDSAVTFNIEKGEVRSRYLIIRDQNRDPKVEDMQYRALLNLKIGFFKDRIRVHMEGSTGKSFPISFNNTGWIGSSSSHEFNIRKLYLAATIKEGVEVSLGSLAPEWGAGTENTTLDADGYIVGYRVQVGLENGYIVVTTGYLGDFNEPDFFRRAHRFADLNYLQAVLNYRILQNIKASLEYNVVSEHHYVRPALSVNLEKWGYWLDQLLVETIVPINSSTDGVFSFATVLRKDFKDVFGDFLPDRDLNIMTQYQYARLDPQMPLGDLTMAGHSLRFQLRVSKLINFPGGSIDALIGYIQSLDFEQKRIFEIGTQIRLN